MGNQVVRWVDLQLQWTVFDSVMEEFHIIIFLVASGHPTSDQRGDNKCPKTDFLAGQMQ